MMIDRERELIRAKWRAFIWLCGAGAVFAGGHMAPGGSWWGIVKAAGEAALVGGLADWFAVVALFRRPMGLPIPHTAVIPRNKDRIADNLAGFVKDRFLTPDAIVGLIQQREPVRLVAAWLATPANARRMGRHVADAVSHAMDLVDDRRVKAFIADAVKAVADKVDLSQGLSAVLRMLTRDGRHEALLVELVSALKAQIEQEDTRVRLANVAASYLKKEHSVIETVLPTQRVSAGLATKAQAWLLEFLTEVAEKPDHEIRAKVNEGLRLFIDRLENDEGFRKRGEDIKRQVMANQDFVNFTQSLWSDLRDWLSDDLSRSVEQSALAGRVQQMGLWVGEKLAADKELSRSLEEHLAAFARDLAPGLADHLVDHIRETIKKWDAQEMTTQLEQQVGTDLQAIRISGTLVGGLIGALLFALSHGLGQAGWFTR